ncbi:pyruvate formate-lyase-activating protein [Ruminococcus sp.]|uniref:pyruvate formate-lyase-activating protein n=1 Tax=Ruminococcus sp. TaxID=41978 RepID=UPI0026002216|nr:pyruvate formate-lyase-activating protein [Ruminococcus sp.]MBQ8967509.1 pyruvate formate lyase-activating protein [Ruminococcus sp.]
MKGYIHSTESYSSVDGPGNRFVVFFQGCPMRCLYCHNPDTWRMEGGSEVTAEELLAEFDSVKEFLKGGGLTCTGGEPCVQIDFLTELFEKAKAKGIHTCLDTSGITFRKNDHAKFDRLMQFTDLVMLDIKHIDPEKHRHITGHDNTCILDFARYLSDIGKPVWIRHVVVPGLTDNEEELFRLGRFIAHIKTLKALDVLPYHTMGKSKYEKLGLDYPLGNTPPMSAAGAHKARDIIMSGLKAEIKDGLHK